MGMANPVTKTMTMMVMASLTLKMRTIPTLTTKMTNCKVFPFPPEIIFQFEMIHLPNCSQSTTILPFRNLLKYCSDKKNKNKNVSFLIKKKKKKKNSSFQKKKKKKKKKKK